ncbi:MAG: hypothetical protein U1E84_15870 [Rhodoferax sp.]
MKTASNLRSSLIGLGIATLSLGALAQSADEHKDHHPTDTASAAKPAPKALAPQPAKAQPSANDKGPAEKMGQMDAKMKTMQDMHEKFMAAKTPEERMALMPDQMKTMQEAMTMMDSMRGGGMGMGMMGGTDKGGMMDKMPMDMMAKHQMMEKRMDMMQSMMQMMMDRMQVPAPN